ncbi:hypothetical protein AGOR_G00138600 [Albula goreensis]|uniref:SEFIR domain-containing protein n=1 Tax=Albula goreensis TaxID=1534307 RepID=A0A8T3DA25_9TELE|nr:hypothetical protein AGOR_G00138600 [Albula goreensis]
MRSLLLIAMFQVTTALDPQINVTCSENTVAGMPSDWLREVVASPSAVRALAVSLADSELALNISWSINIDKSNEYLSGTWICVDQRCFNCQYQPHFNEVNTTGYEQLWFQFTDITAEPDNLYTVAVINLPVPMIGSDSGWKMISFPSPNCSEERMKHHHSCSEKEPEWNPNITSRFSNGQAEVSFSCSSSTEFRLELWRCDSEEKCHQKDFNEFIAADKFTTQEGESRCMGTLNSTLPCENLFVLITQNFPECDKCAKTLAVDCAPRGISGEQHPKDPPRWPFWLGLCSIMMMLLPVAALKWCQRKKSHSGFGELTGTIETNPPLSVLVVYPAENRVFQRAVLAFADFLQSQWHCRVVIDVWQRARMAEQGPMCWLTKQMEHVNKVIIVCAPRKEDRDIEAAHCHLPSLRDHTIPASTEDVFSLAVNMVAGQAQSTTALRKYCTVHLGDKPDKNCLPAALRLCEAYSMMSDVEKLGSHLYHTTGGRFCCFSSLGLKQQSLNSEAARKLREAIQELQTCEKSQSDRPDGSTINALGSKEDILNGQTSGTFYSGVNLYR